MTISDLVGSEWESKDGRRGLVVLSEAAPWRGEIQFLVKGTHGSTRERLIGYHGLRAKYRRIDTPAPTAQELKARVAKLEEFVADLAGHGLRFDLDPTLLVPRDGSVAPHLIDYLTRADSSIRERAAALLPEVSS
ncbi:hypothetical protein [Nocardia sp. NPDC060249]|uniref:hypothetical protein n=1 Tax=Nocardia sp. NPDC060249 TaxID=3347082 RepID=UPI0036542C7E